MVKMIIAAAIAVAFMCNCIAQSPVLLKCEHLAAPLGIDAAQPRLSWQLDDDRKGAKQTAYRVYVGTDPVAIRKGYGNYWQTATISSDAQLIVYAGKPLQPFTRYYWTVQVWDKDRKALPIKEVSFFLKRA